MEMQLISKTITLGNFGVEIECTGVDNYTVSAALNNVGVFCMVEYYNYTTRGHWKIVSDCSVHGDYAKEIVSPVLNGQAGLDQLKIVCHVLNELGIKVNRSCGLHVHHEGRGFKPSIFETF